MPKRKVVEDSYIPKDVSIKVTILPAFKVIIESDSTGKKWSGHAWYDDTAIGVLRRMRNSLALNEYRGDNIIVRATNPTLARATTWKEAVIDDE